MEEAWLHAIAHAESAHDADAVSDKGAKGVMQLMPQVIGDYGIKDPFSARQSIMAGARLLASLQFRYESNLTLVAAAYNAGVGAVTSTKACRPTWRHSNTSPRCRRCMHATATRWVANLVLRDCNPHNRAESARANR